jgi:hypothetical protein
MNSGKPQKPASLKLLTGNAGKHKSIAELEREASLEPQPDVLEEIPKAPRHLKAVGRAEWTRVCTELVNTRRLTPGMLSMIEHLCYVHQHVREMELLGATPNAALLGQLRLMYESFGLTTRSLAGTKSVSHAKENQSPLAKFQRIK